MKRFTAAALSIVLSVGVSAGVAQAQDFSDPATTPGKITAHPKKQSLLQPPVEATIYAEPYGIVPDHHAAANFSPLGTRKSAKIRGSLHQPPQLWRETTRLLKSPQHYLTTVQEFLHHSQILWKG